MNPEIKKVIRDIEDLGEKLENLLPGDDPTHRDEILDICNLLKIRTEMYFREYGILEN